MFCKRPPPANINNACKFALVIHPSTTARWGRPPNTTTQVMVHGSISNQKQVDIKHTWPGAVQVEQPFCKPHPHIRGPQPYLHEQAHSASPPTSPRPLPLPHRQSMLEANDSVANLTRLDQVPTELPQNCGWYIHSIQPHGRGFGVVQVRHHHAPHMVNHTPS